MSIAAFSFSLSVVSSFCAPARQASNQTRLTPQSPHMAGGRFPLLTREARSLARANCSSAASRFASSHAGSQAAAAAWAASSMPPSACRPGRVPTFNFLTRTGVAQVNLSQYGAGCRMETHRAPALPPPRGARCPTPRSIPPNPRPSPQPGTPGSATPARYHERNHRRTGSAVKTTLGRQAGPGKVARGERESAAAAMAQHAPLVPIWRRSFPLAVVNIIRDGGLHLPQGAVVATW
jgi:hypothetical protein